MDCSALLAAWPESSENNVCLLIEAGAQSEKDFLAFHSERREKMYSLYIHPQLTEFQNYGPWLLEVKDKAQLSELLSTLPGCSAVIASSRYPSFLAIQLSRGCTIVSPDGSTELVRFYANHVITVLAKCADSDWHAFLFRDISQWWLPGEVEWQQLNIKPSEVEHPANHIIKHDKATWQQIADKPEVSSVLNEWQKMPSSQQFPPCAQRLMVMKALKKGEDTGLLSLVDQKIFALCYLDERKDILISPLIDKYLPDINGGKQSLAELILQIN
ncbi:TPA: DUF4123 domain-containing protein [Enterobacter hormaechei subsp. steigerwaltii]|nr:DUF4123 domain-containing protein [Enterobacter hormaechei subsp. steigerwaltii]